LFGESLISRPKTVSGRVPVVRD